jgi:signal transduction histidine kinase/ActR/RegA family two-component response regulator
LKKYHFNIITITCLFWLLVGVNIPIFSQEILYDNNGKKLTLKDFWVISAQKETQGDKKEATRYLNAAASHYWEIKNYDSAIWYYNKSISLNETIGNDTGITGISNNLGMIYADIRQYEKSLSYFDKVLKDRKKIKEPVSIIAGLINSSVVLNNLKRHQKAAEYLEEALDLARQMNDVDQMKSCYGMLAETYEKAGNQEKTIFYFNLYRSFHELSQKEKVRVILDTLDEVKMKLQISELEKQNKQLALNIAKVELEEREKDALKFDSVQDALLLNASKKELLIELLKQRMANKELDFAKKEAEDKATIANERLIRNIGIATLIVGLVGFMLLYRNYKEKKHFNEQLYERNVEIMAQGDKIHEQNKVLEYQKIELEKALLEKEEAVKEKSRFLSTMSHEIRTPMNAVIGFTNILLMESPANHQIEYLNSLKFSANHLLSLLNDILDFSKIEAGKITFEKTRFDLNNTLEELRKMFSIRAEEKKIELSLTLPHQKLKNYLVGDLVRLNQVLTNLIGNAVKFTNNGSVNISYQILEESEDKYKIRFSIADTGIGIPADKIDSIFESFTQASLDTTRKFGGTGLGLAISKKLVDLQGGKIWVESLFGKGSTFFVEMELIKGTEIIAKSELKNIEINVSSSKSLNNMKILLVEDNKMNVMVAKKLLEKWDTQLDFANDGVEAVQKVSINQTYDLILMDLHMPNMGGIEATHQIRNLKGDYFQNIPIIALTASASAEVRENVIKNGMNACVIKPFNPDSLFDILKKHGEQMKMAS